MEDFQPLKPPAISYRREPGSHLMSLLIKARYPAWGAPGALADEANRYFEAHYADRSASQVLDQVNAFAAGGPDEEALYLLALTYGREERADDAVSALTRHKGLADAGKVRSLLAGSLQVLEESPTISLLEDKFTVAEEEDLEARRRDLKDAEAKVSSIIHFYRPDARTTTVGSVVILPTDALRPKERGLAFILGHELFVMSHIDNPQDLEHELIHAIIDPIADKLLDSLTDAEKERVLALASGKSKQAYGTDLFGILSDDLITTYNEVFRGGRRPATFQDFRQQVINYEPGEFEQMMESSPALKARCDLLGIRNRDDLNDRTQEYYEAFERNDLMNVAFGMYKDYAREAESTDVNFERFVFREFPARITPEWGKENEEQPAEIQDYESGL